MNRINVWIAGLAAGAVAIGWATAADITVSAAASLTNAFQEIGKQYEREHPSDRVLFNFGSSGQLLQQIARGAPVDVFASADQESMDKAEKEGAIDRSSRFDFVRNQLVLVVPADSRLSMRELREVSQSGVKKIAIGNPDSVPAGRYAKAALEKAGLWSALQDRFINTVNVRQALDYVARGEVDAGFVYASDALLMPVRVKAVLPVDVPQPILYPVAVVRGGGNQKGGAAFVAYLKSATAAEILGRFGFQKP
ncbi:MAG: molybdate ABC transporter substrate-binding protein [Betaproteobacteria bacterium]|nr:molybdate ABC transporter substrate-binding protein [Betaproteobacteria bacterium]